VLVIQTGTIAAVAVAFATYAGQLWPALAPEPPLVTLGPVAVSPVQAVAVGVILLLTAVNARGLEAGRRVQNVFTVAKVATLLAVIALGLALGGGAARAANLARPAFATGLGVTGTAMQLGRRWSGHSSPRMRGPTSPSPPARCAMRAGPYPARWCSARRWSACSI